MVLICATTICAPTMCRFTNLALKFLNDSEPDLVAIKRHPAVLWIRSFQVVNKIVPWDVY